MKKLILLLTILPLFFFDLYSQPEPGWRNGEKQIKISANYFESIYPLKLSSDYHPEDNTFTYYVVPSELSQIESLGIPYITEIEDLNNYKRDFFILEEQYHTYQEIINLADSLEQNFGSICKKYIYGTSLGNRQCAALKISDNVAVDENEPEVMFDGGIHGDEVGGSENIIRLARDLCIKYSTEPLIADLINTREIWLYLMVNPDGRQNNVRYNQNFVDLNRDYGYMWDGEGSSPGAFSQVETRALRSCMYDNQFVVHTSYHSGTQFVSYPWSYRPNQCLDYSHTHQLAGVYAATSGYGGTLPYEQGYSGMYPINGSTKDGNYAMMGSVSWSIEISFDKHPPNSQILQYYNYNYPSMIALIKYSGYGIEGVVTDAQTGLPVPAAIYINNYYPSYTDPVVGDFHKYVLPGTYTVTAKANGYEPVTVSNVVVTANSSTPVNIQLTSNAQYSAFRFCASRIPGNNFSDEGLTPAALGMPDNINYSIGKSGWCILDMQTPIQNLAGNDLTVYEGDLTAEGFLCAASMSMDGPWVSLGSGTGTVSFDLGTLAQARYIKITDDGDGVAIAADAGYDLDAVVSLHPVPVELSSFTANIKDHDVVISWVTSTETNNSGFEIEKNLLNDNTGWTEVVFIPGHGTSTERHSYSYTDQKPGTGNILYRLKQVDLDGTFRIYGPLEVNAAGISEYSIAQNYPNPFNPATKIKYQIAGSGSDHNGVPVRITVFDVLGNEITTLVNENKTAGSYEVDFNASGISSGVYYYTMKAGDFIQSRKMIILK